MRAPRYYRGSPIAWRVETRWTRWLAAKGPNEKRADEDSRSGGSRFDFVARACDAIRDFFARPDLESRREHAIPNPVTRAAHTALQYRTDIEFFGHIGDVEIFAFEGKRRGA